MDFCKFDNALERPARQLDFEKDAAPPLRAPRLEPTILGELVELLASHPGGLRRWSVMRTIRDNRNRASRPTSLKFESEVERVFRGSCSNCAEPNKDTQKALFYRPEGKAGEVWAVHAERAREWLAQR